MINWRTYNPPGSYDGGTALDDLESRTTSAQQRAAYAPYPVTYTHELAHQLNAQLRNQLGPAYNAAYCGQGRYVAYVEPTGVTLAHVAAQVVAYRNSTYRLYLVQQQRYWQRQPLYVLDEWSCYLLGSRQAKDTQQPDPSSDQRCAWFAYYSVALIHAIRQHQPSYQHLQELELFVIDRLIYMDTLLGISQSIINLLEWKSYE